jgi:hypothetical protein
MSGPEHDRFLPVITLNDRSRRQVKVPVFASRRLDGPATFYLLREGHHLDLVPEPLALPGLGKSVVHADNGKFVVTMKVDRSATGWAIMGDKR